MDYTEKLTVLQYALEQYTRCDEGENVPESVVEAFVTKILVSKDGFDWYLRSDGNPDKPLHCQLEGSRKQTAKIVVSGAISPAIDNSTTGRYQRLKEIKKLWSSRHLMLKSNLPVLGEPGDFLFTTAIPYGISASKHAPVFRPYDSKNHIRQNGV